MPAEYSPRNLNGTFIDFPLHDSGDLRARLSYKKKKNAEKVRRDKKKALFILDAEYIFFFFYEPYADFYISYSN